MDMTSDLVREAAEMALATLGLKGVELEDAKRFTVNYALSNTSIRQRFSTALTDEHYISKAQGHTATVSRNVPSDLGLPTLRMPTVIRQKQTRHKMKIDHRVSAQTMEFFNKHYSRLFEFNFTQLYSHDHPEAAASRKIESEEVMYMLRAEGADMLRSPVSTYDCSIIDVGGDWRYHYVRQHIGVHCDVPFLDARDITRDARKRLQLKCTTDNEHFVCRDKMQDCTITGPYMMAIHSVLYTSTILEVCESMTRRGTHYFVGTMQLPDNLETMYTSYVDPDYGYTIEYKDPDLVVAGKYLPPPMRAGLGKYMINDKRHKLVYRYPSGQSCEYIHDRAVLLEKLYDGTYYVYTKNGDKLSFEYKIVKRVGSLVYASIRLSSTEPPAHRVQMVYPVKSYVDDYVVRVDGNLLSNFSIKFARATDISVPRQLFTAVAVYCMTKVRNPAFCIEEAIAYGFSAASQIEANGVILHIGTMSADRNVVVITAAVASFFFAFDRFRLIEHRIPQLTVADTNEEVQKSMLKVFQDYVGVKPIYESLKNMFVRTAEDMAVDYLIDKGTSYGDIRKIYEQLTAITTPGISKIRDMAHCYVQLQPLHAVIKRRDAHYGGRLVDSAIFVTPTYELEPDNRVVCLRKQAAELREKYRNVADGVQLKPLSKVEDLVLEPTTSAVKSHDNFDDTQQDVDRDEYSLNASRVALDAILMVTAAEDERMQSAREIFLRVFDNNSGNLRSVECLKGTVKGKPLLAHLIEGSVVKITTLEREYHKGEEGFDTVASQLSTDRFIYPRRKEDNTFECGYAVFIDNQYMRDDDSCRVIFDTVTALHMPDLKILNSKNLLPLKSLVARGNFPPQVHSVLANECAGSGKTHDQCMRYKAAVEFGRSVAIFASTKAAAGQAKSRLEAWKVPIAPYSISTVDSYLMNTRAWETTFHEVYIDEALQLHAGKIYCIIKLASPRILRGYGDRKQIGYIPFTRFHTPSVSTEFPWSEEHTNLVTRRIPNDSTIVPWLRSEIFYGPQFKSVSHRTKAVVSYSRIAAIEGQLTMSTIYGIMGISHSSELMILVYLQEEAARLRSKLGLARTMPESEDCEYKACVCTMGEAQGEDVDNVIVMRLSTKQEPLHGDAGQTTVALTRHKQRWAYLAVTSQFPTLIEQMGGVPETHGSMSSIITSATRF